MAMKTNVMKKAFEALDNQLKSPVKILIGGGAALMLAHGVPLTTMDVDGLIMESLVTPAELDPLVKKVAQELKINPHWFNSFFSTFTYTMPADYRDRLTSVHNGKNLKVFALGLEDLLIMKCFAGREKDIGHAMAIVKKGADVKLVELHIEKLRDKGLPGAQKAMEFLEDIIDQAGI